MQPDHGQPSQTEVCAEFYPRLNLALCLCLGCTSILFTCVFSCTFFLVRTGSSSSPSSPSPAAASSGRLALWYVSDLSFCCVASSSLVLGCCASCLVSFRRSPACSNAWSKAQRPNRFAQPACIPTSGFTAFSSSCLTLSMCS